MKITNQQEEAIIQDLLPKMLEQPGHPFPLAEAVPDDYLVVIQNRMTTEGLITVFAADERAYLVRLTTKGIAVARHTGGYKGYLQGEQQNQVERDTREQRTAQATLDSVRANWWAVRVSLVGVLVGAVFSGISLWQSSGTATDLNAANTKIKVLQQEVIDLKAQAAAPARPAAAQPQAAAPVPPARVVPTTQAAPQQGDKPDKNDD